MKLILFIFLKRSILAGFLFFYGNSSLEAQGRVIDTFRNDTESDATLYQEQGVDSTNNYNTVDSAHEEGAEVREPDTVIYRAVPDTVVNSFQKRKEFEYANDPEYWIKTKEKETESDAGFAEWLFFSPVLRTVMYFILATVLVFAVYKIIINNNLFYTSTKKKNAQRTGEEMVEEMGDLEGKIKLAIEAKDYRKAIRYLYGKALRDLDQKNLIRYHTQATNDDYLGQISPYRFAGQFTFLTRVYDYVWYGGFEISPTQFERVLNDFTVFYKEVDTW